MKVSNSICYDCFTHWDSEEYGDVCPNCAAVLNMGEVVKFIKNQKTELEALKKENEELKENSKRQTEVFRKIWEYANIIITAPQQVKEQKGE